MPRKNEIKMHQKRDSELATMVEASACHKPPGTRASGFGGRNIVERNELVKWARRQPLLDYYMTVWVGNVATLNGGHST